MPKMTLYEKEHAPSLPKDVFIVHFMKEASFLKREPTRVSFVGDGANWLTWPDLKRVTQFMSREISRAYLAFRILKHHESRMKLEVVE